MEEESDGKLSFLDVSIENTDISIKTTLYHKQTFSERYLNYIQTTQSMSILEWFKDFFRSLIF